MKVFKTFFFGKKSDWQSGMRDAVYLVLMSGIAAGLIAGLLEILIVVPWPLLRKWGFPLYYLAYLSLPSIVYAICGALSGLLALLLLRTVSRKYPQSDVEGRYLPLFGPGYRVLPILFLLGIVWINRDGMKGTLFNLLGWPVLLAAGFLFLSIYNISNRVLLALIRRGFRLRLLSVSMVTILSCALLLLGDFSYTSVRGKPDRSPRGSLEGEKDNVILITIDTQRADYLGCYENEVVQTPALDTFAREGVRFDYCIAQSPLTLPSHTSIMTSTYPFYHGIRINGVPAGSELLTLAEVLQGNGFHTAAFVSAFVLNNSFGLDQGFETYDGNFGELQYYFLSRILKRSPSYKALNTLNLLHQNILHRRADETTESALAWIEEHRDETFFAWIHYFDPHSPWEPPAPYDTLYADQVDRQVIGDVEIITLHETKSIPLIEVEKMKSLYMGEISYMDEYFHLFREELARMDLLEKTLVVITADHGESFAENNYLGHGGSVNDPSIRIPLIFSRPGRIPAGVVVEGLCESIDIMPTILDYLAVESVPDIHGRSLLPFFESGSKLPDRSGYSEAMGSGDEKKSLWSLVRPGWKYVYNPWIDEGSLFRLDEDHKEEEDLSVTYPDQTEEMKAELLSVVETLSSPDTLRSKEIRPEAQDALRALGYVQ